MTPALTARMASMILLISSSLLMMRVPVASSCQLQESAAAPKTSPDDLFRLISQLKSTVGDNPQSEMSQAGEQTPQNPERKFDSGQLGENSLERKLEMLRRVMNEKNAARPPQAPPAGISPVPPEPSTLSSPGTEETAASLPSGQSVGIAGTISQNPVDSMELAASLFATGNYPLALKTWRQIESQVVDPEERQWMEYFMASCMRLTGDRESAEAAYRELASTKPEGYAVKSARAWLAWLERQKRTEDVRQQIFDALDQIEREYESNGK